MGFAIEMRWLVFTTLFVVKIEGLLFSNPTKPIFSRVASLCPLGDDESLTDCRS